MSLKHRERVMMSLRHQEPDRIPMDLCGTINSSIHAKAYQKLKAYFGVKDEDIIIQKFMQTALVHEPILQALDVDFRYLAAGSPDSKPEISVEDDAYQDEYGVVRRRPPGSFYYDIIKSPLAGSITSQDVLAFTWPDPTDPGYTRGLSERIKEYRRNTDCALVLRIPSAFVHLTQYLRGFEDWFTDLAADQKLAGFLFDATLEHSMALTKQILRVGGHLVDIVATGDDLGIQNGPIVSPELYRNLFKPRHKKFIDMVKQHTSAFIHFHSCGSIYKLLPDLIEIGIDAIHPVQVAARDMDSQLLKKEFGDQLCFWGAIDTQHVLPNATTVEVELEVKRRIRDLAPHGGYILSAVHNIQPDVPLENIIRMYEAGKQYGKYPLSID